jgi:hypothetical protein
MIHIACKGDFMEKKGRSEYMDRQIYIMSSIGIFYVIMIALFAIPLIGTFVVIIIKGVLDFRMVILIGGIVVMGFLVFYMGKFIFRLWQKFKHGGFSDISDTLRSGQPFQISFLSGLVNISSGNQADMSPKALPYRNSSDTAMLPAPESKDADIVSRLKELSELRTQGVIDDEEFILLKKKLISALSES